MIGCTLVKKIGGNKVLWGVIVETEAYSQKEPACHGHKKRTPSNQTLFGEPGRFYIYLTYGIYHCVNIVTDKSEWASGVLLRALSMPDEEERICSGPGLLARKFKLDRTYDNRPISKKNGLWVINKSSSLKNQKIVKTTRIGISQAKDLQWRWYLQSSRSVSKRAKGDQLPSTKKSWSPSIENSP